ncbi:MAG: methyltransferase domain-containing protein [Gemmatimonadetes bacterium]|nr:methyltransferase domain-containing protein [Gemmatimonadota bacterium]
MTECNVDMTTHRSERRNADGEPRHIDRSYYDESTYFEDAAHLRDFNSRFQRYRIAKVLQLCAPRPTDRVMDLGCGWGTISLALGPIAGEVIGIDFAQRAVDSCNRRLGAAGLENVRFRCADARDTGMRAASFDLVVAADLFEHLYPDDSRKVAREAFRVLRPGGTCAVWTPCPSHILEVLRNRDIILKRDISHVDYKSMPRMQDILTAAGFEIARAHYAESHLRGLNLAERLLQRWVPLLRRRIAVVAVKPGDP